MNKQLIIRYFKEFNHWLNGGKLLHKDEFNNWENSRDIWDLKTECIKAIVIDDEYVEFRKALAEGREIEYSITDLNGNHLRWVNILKQENSYNVDTKVFNYELSAYRIKPEEPKFKVGDWVSNKQNPSIIKQIIRTSNNSDSLTVGNEQRGINVMLKTDVELWQPQSGEWCWFYNSLTDTPTLSKLISIESIYERPKVYLAETPSCISKTSYGYSSSMIFKFCEPFIGQLPTFLKDNM